MRLGFLICLLIPTLAWGWKAEEIVFLNGCRISDSLGNELKIYPGLHCALLGNGDALSAGLEELRYITKVGDVLWQIPGSFHHQVNLSHDEKNVLALRSIIKSFQNEEDKRFDALSVYDLNGKVLKEIEATEIFRQANQAALEKKFFWLKDAKVYHEGSHFNSFHEIPPLTAGKKYPSYIKAGNYVANSLRQGVYILDADLKKVLFHFQIPTSVNHSIHDVQVTTEGRLLYFNNTARPSTPERPFSTVEEMDLNTMKVVTEIKSNPPELFHSVFCGGVQVIDADTIMFSHQIAGVYFYSRVKKQITFATQKPNWLGNEFRSAQQVRMTEYGKLFRKTP